MQVFTVTLDLIFFQGLTQNISAPSDKSEHSQNKASQGRGRDPPDRGDPGPPAAKRPRPAAANATTTPSSARLNSFKKETSSSNSGGGLNADGRNADVDDDIQEVVPVKTEPRDLQSAAATAAAASTAMTAVTAASYAAPSREEGGSEGGGQLALDEDYAEDNYDYGEYDGDGGGGLYGDDSGLMDPNTGLPIPAGSDGNKGRVKSTYF